MSFKRKQREVQIRKFTNEVLNELENRYTRQLVSALGHACTELIKTADTEESIDIYYWCFLTKLGKIVEQYM